MFLSRFYICNLDCPTTKGTYAYTGMVEWRGLGDKKYNKRPPYTHTPLVGWGGYLGRKTGVSVKNTSFFGKVFEENQ